MIYIKLDEGMNLVMTQYEPIYRGDHLNQKITYLIPLMVGDIDMLSAAVYLSYIRADGTADIALLTREKDTYNDRYYQYHLPVTSTLSRYAGEICTFLQIFSGPPRHPVVAKSGECVLRVIDSRNMDEYISDRNLRLVYEMQRYMEDKLENAERSLSERLDKTEDAIALKADNLVFHKEDSTVQLVSTVTVENEKGEEELRQIPIGDRIFVRADSALAIDDMEIAPDGHLIVTFDNQTTKDLGRVVGKDGAVYVPNIDAHKILTFTVEKTPTATPDPVDLNPFDEWGDIGSGAAKTAYVWGNMAGYTGA